MAPRTTAKNSNPAALVADALSSLQKVVGNALASTEDRCKTELAKGRKEIEEARRERDDALNQLRTSKLQCKEWERRGEAWSGSTEKFDLTIEHQAETITRLREEAQQWKNQLLRHEETSRREIEDWKEQYLRAEQERSRLSDRLAQLLAERFDRSGHTSGSILAYSSRMSNAPGPSGTHRSSSLKTTTKQSGPVAVARRKSKSVRPAADSNIDQECTYLESDSRPTLKPPTASTSTEKTLAAPRASTLHPKLSPPHISHSTLIRRVRAIIEVPVKEEEYSDYEGLGSRSGSEDSAYVRARPKSFSSSLTSSERSSIKGKERAQHDFSDDNDDEEEEERTERPQERFEEVEDACDDDQLLLASEDDEELPQRKIGTKRKALTQMLPPARELRKTANPAKKRKLDTDTVTAQKTQAKRLRRR